MCKPEGEKTREQIPSLTILGPKLILPTHCSTSSSLLLEGREWDKSWRGAGDQTQAFCIKACAQTFVKSLWPSSFWGSTPSGKKGLLLGGAEDHMECQELNLGWPHANTLLAVLLLWCLVFPFKTIANCQRNGCGFLLSYCYKHQKRKH